MLRPRQTPLTSWLNPQTRLVFRRRFLQRPFSRNVVTKDQIKTAELQRAPDVPNQIATEIPHSKAASFVAIPSPLWYYHLSYVRNFVTWFSRNQRVRPLTMTLATSMTTYLCGDILAQEIGGEPYNGFRTIRMLAIGLLVSVPGYRWFMYLGSHFNYKSKFLSIGTKVMIQQFFFAPIFNTYFFAMQAILAGQTPAAIISRIKKAVPESVISSAKFWPAVTALNFTLVPPALRFMVSGVFAIVWQTYLSFLNRKAEKGKMSATLTEEAQRRLAEVTSTD